MNNEFWGVLITSFVSGGLATHVFTWLTSRKQEKTNIDVTVSEAWKNYAQKLEERLQEIENKYADLYREYLELRDECTLLKTKLDHARS